MAERPSPRVVAAAFLVGLGAAWNGGNVGPIVAPLSADLDVSVAAVGLLSGTVFFAAIVVAALLATSVAARIGVASAMRLVCLLCCAGNLLCAVSPTFAGVAAGRVVTGAGLGLAFVLAPVFARAHGGVRLVGLVGASIQLGVATALGIGSVLQGAGVDWRLSFGLAAVVGLSALPLLPRWMEAEAKAVRPRHLLRAEVRDPDVWRLALLFVATLTVPLIVGAWLVHYLVVAGMSGALAGVLAFVLFAGSAAMRFVGGGLSASGGRAPLLAGASPLLAAAGIAVLALDTSPGAVLAAVLLMGSGFALPYAVMLVEAQWLFPTEPVAPLSLLTLVANAVPIVGIPLVGSALQDGRGETAFLVLAGIVAVAGLVNLPPPTRRIVPG